MERKKTAKSLKPEINDFEELFTEKELLVIRMVCGQASNKKIADKMELSLRTIEGYRRVILRKMKMKNTAGLVVYAIRSGIYKI